MTPGRAAVAIAIATSSACGGEAATQSTEVAPSRDATTTPSTTAAPSSTTDTTIGTTPTDPTAPPSTAPPSTTSTGPPASSDDVERAQLATSTEADPTPPGSYATDALAVELFLDTTAPLLVPFHEDGKVVLAETGRGDEYIGVQFHALDSFVDSDAQRAPTERLGPDVDLGSWLSGHATIDLVDSGSGQIGGLPGDWFHIESPAGCQGCWTPLLLSQGWTNSWGIPSGYSMTLWRIDAAGSPLAIIVEAPTDEFVARQLDAEAVIGAVRFGEPTGHSPARPRGPAVGEYPVGRDEAVVVDSSRPTLESRAGESVTVRGAEQRRLLLSVSYPSVDGGFGAAPAPGSYPLVVVAPALWDAGASLPQDQILATHGYVVVSVRFPESSWPGGNVAGVPSQPGDVSFALDEVLDGALGEALSDVVDPDRVALVGHSAGATTVYGILQSECCTDDRFDAAIAHGGTPYDFASEPVAAVAPVLHVASADDAVAPFASIEDLHRSIEGSSTLAVYDDVAHLEWLRPDSDAFADVVELSLAFLGRHLVGATVDLSAVSELATSIDER